MTRRALDLIKGLVTLVATLAALTVIPLGLVRWIGNPLPTTIPTLDEVSLALRSGLNPDLVINLVAIVVWFTWAQLVVALALETVAVVRHNRAHRVPLLPGLQQFAARTVATIALVASTLGPARGPAAFATTAPAAAVHESTHTLVIDPTAIDASPAVTAAPVPTRTAGNGHVSYTTQRFDTLWDIAERTLGDPTRWNDIQDLNTGRTMADGTTFTTDTHLSAGWVLHLPADANIDETEDAAARTVEVQRGDHFWSLAQAALAEAWGRQPTAAETTPYWQQLVDANRDRLAPPHDPDLIYPGQEFTLPPPPPDPQAASSTKSTGVPVAVAGEVVVERGDHFWGIATRTLATEWDRQPTDTEVAGYWQSLIDLNQQRLRPPHNPDLIFPGQVFTLPSIPADPAAGDAPPRLDESSGTRIPAADPIPEGGPGTNSATTAPPTDTTEAMPPTVAVEQPVGGGDPVPLDIDADDFEDESELDDDSDASVDEEPADGGLLPAVAKVAGLGILAAGVMALLNRLRLVQLRRRRPGTIPTPPPDNAIPVETTLRVAEAPTALNLLDYALRSIPPHIADNHLPEPDIFGAQISDDGLRLFLWTPHDQPPPGWDTAASGKEWFLPASTDLEHLRHTGAGVYASWPAFVTLGHHDTTQVLVNLEHLGAVQVTGATDDVHDTFATIAVELATSPIADTMTIYCIGFGHDLAHLERIQPVDDLSDVLPNIEPVLDAVHAAPDTTVIAGRTQPSADLWEPIVVLDPSPTPPAQATRLLTAALSRSPISAAVAYPTGDRWKLTIDNHTVRLEPLGITLDRRNLTPTEQTGIAELTAAAQDLEGHPHLDLTQIDLFGPTGTETSPNGAVDGSPPSDSGEPPADRDTADSPVSATGTDGTSAEASTTETAPRVTVASGQGSRYDVRVLGPVRIDGLDGGFPRDTCREIVTYLATHPRGTTADALHEAIWPDQGPATRRIVRYLYDARRTLGTTPDGKLYVPKAGPDGRYRLHPAIGCDLNRFEAHIRDAAATTPDEKTEHMKAALALVEGPPFSGVSSGYDWAYTEGFVSQATIAIDDTAHHLSEHALTNNDPDTATWAARKGILVTRACEHCYRNLMKVGITANNPVAVEAAYRELVAITEADEGPHSTHLLAPETIALYEQHRRTRPESRRQRRGEQPGAA